IAVTHSIPDAVSAAITTPYGTVVHTADFKLDPTPLDNRLSDLNRFAEWGDKGVLLFICDVTNVYRPGMVDSERTVGVRFAQIMEKAKGRVLVASFASHLHRLQQAIEVGARYGRRTALIGRSMLKNVATALQTGHLPIDPGLLIPIEKIDQYPDNEVLVLMTGSQGEPGSGMTRIATGNHHHMTIKDTDVVIISAQPIPGNEANISRAVNKMFERGANVYYGPNAGVHVSGHANRGEIKLLMNMVKAQNVMPYHGENRHFREFRELAMKMGYARNNVVVGGIGDIMQFDSKGLIRTLPNPHAGVVLIDGALGEEYGSKLLEERKELAEGGVVIVSLVLDKDTNVLTSFSIESKGFLLAKNADGLFEQAEVILTESVIALINDAGQPEIEKIEARIRNKLQKLFQKKIQRKPLIIPIIHQV
ncbi:MAG: ribonuclease J, partial [bacterium]